MQNLPHNTIARLANETLATNAHVAASFDIILQA